MSDELSTTQAMRAEIMKKSSLEIHAMFNDLMKKPADKEGRIFARDNIKLSDAIAIVRGAGYTVSKHG